jgi:CRP-like cAMP-binding protein
MHDIAEFLRTHSPFDSLDEKTLAEVADRAEIEFYAARAVILDSAEVAEFAYVVRRGSVEAVIDGRLLDDSRGRDVRLRLPPVGGPARIRALTGAHWDLRARQLWHGPGGLRPSN